MRVTIVVLGDAGNSPRMQYHALALATKLADVDFVGYAGSPLPPRIATHPHIRLHLLPPPAPLAPHIPRPLFVGRAAWRVLDQWARLLWLLLVVIRRFDFVLVQNPPAVPTLLVALVAARLRAATLVIDWHNFGYAMLALRLRSEHFIVRAARWYERVVGRRANAHFCVSRAMQSELAERWGIHAIVLYDQPLETPGPAPLAVRRDLFDRMRDIVGWDANAYHPDAQQRPAFIISPTSWTADEDFSVLLDALERWERMVLAPEDDKHSPDLLVLITGRGPLRTAFEARMRQLTSRRVHVHTVWVPADDYPLLLGAADLGLCFHRSASGVDLPMKVVDMFGAGLPVCALDYGPCLAEQVRHGETGLLFANAVQLAEQLYDLFHGFPDDTPLLDRLRHNVAVLRNGSWWDEWAAQAQPVFSRGG